MLENTQCPLTVKRLNIWWCIHTTGNTQNNENEKLQLLTAYGLNSTHNAV